MTYYETFMGGAVHYDNTGDVMLNPFSKRVHIFNPDSSGYFVHLPDARDTRLGAAIFYIVNSNENDYTLGIKDDAGSVLETLDDGYGAIIGLAKNDTAAGDWMVAVHGVGIASAPIEILSDMYIISGTAGPTDNEQYDDVTELWDAKAPMSSYANVKHSAAMPCVSEYGYFVGADAGSNPRLDRYTPNEWASKTIFAGFSRMWSAYGTIDGKCYLWGGKMAIQTNTSIADTEEYDPTGVGTWTARADADVIRALHGAGVYDGSAYLFGGYTKTYVYTLETEKYTPTDTWVSKADTPASHNGCAGWTQSHRIYAAGAQRPGAPDYVVDVSEYTPDPTNTWGAAPDNLPVPGRSHARGVCLNNYGHVVGGHSSAAPNLLDDHDIYDHVSQTWSSGTPFTTPTESMAGGAIIG